MNKDTDDINSDKSSSLSSKHIKLNENNEAEKRIENDDKIIKEWIIMMITAERILN